MTYHCFFPNADLVREVHLNLEHSPRLASRDRRGDGLA